MKELKQYQIWVPCILAVSAYIVGGITHNYIFFGIGLFFNLIQFYTYYIINKRYKDELKKLVKDIEFNSQRLKNETKIRSTEKK